MIRVILIGGKSNATLEKDFQQTNGIEVVKSFEFAADFFDYMDTFDQALVEFDKVILIQHGIKPEDSFAQVKNIQDALAFETALRPTFYVLLTDDNLYSQFTPDNLVYEKTNILLTKKIIFKEVYQTLIGTFDSKGIKHRKFNHNLSGYEDLIEEMERAVAEDETKAAETPAEPPVPAPKLTDGVPDIELPGATAASETSEGSLDDFFGSKSKKSEKSGGGLLGKFKLGRGVKEPQEAGNEIEHLAVTEPELVPPPVKQEPPPVQSAPTPPAPPEIPENVGHRPPGAPKGRLGKYFDKFQQKLESNPQNLPDGSELGVQETPKTRKNSPDIVVRPRGTYLLTGDRGAGTSSTVANLAMQLSQHGKTVILDLDIKRRGVTRYFPKAMADLDDVRQTYGVYSVLNNPKTFVEAGIPINEQLLLLTLTEPYHQEVDAGYERPDKIGGRSREELLTTTNIINLVSFLRTTVNYLIIDMPFETFLDHSEIALQADTNILCLQNSEGALESTLMVDLISLQKRQTMLFETIAGKFSFLLTRYNPLCLHKKREITPEYFQNYLATNTEIWANSRVIGKIPFFSDFEKQTYGGQLLANTPQNPYEILLTDS